MLVYIEDIKCKHGNTMSFANTVKKELRAAFGPQWVASAVQWIVIAGGLALIGMIGLGVIDLANGLNETLEGQLK